jgi:hypothetical protein
MPASAARHRTHYTRTHDDRDAVPCRLHARIRPATSDARAIARTGGGTLDLALLFTDLRGWEPPARRSPARTIAFLFARVANAVPAARVGGERLITTHSVQQ